MSYENAPMLVAAERMHALSLVHHPEWRAFCLSADKLASWRSRTSWLPTEVRLECLGPFGLPQAHW